MARRLLTALAITVALLAGTAGTASAATYTLPDLPYDYGALEPQ